MITHTVQFRFKQGLSELDKADFMTALHHLSTIPGVLDFGIFQQVSQGNSFEYLATMRFKNSEDYQKYTRDPQHTSFIDKEWIPKVEAFLEGDYLEWQA
jgi:antibiotic biosynthesis monooxygenase (ABM) superfamily enzyme